MPIRRVLPVGMDFRDDVASMKAAERAERIEADLCPECLSPRWEWVAYAASTAKRCSACGETW